jgi:hypothetical protein
MRNIVIRNCMYYLKHEQERFIRFKTRERSSSVLYLIKHWRTASVLNGLKKDPSDEFIGHVISKMKVVYQPRKSKLKFM